jgi:hypothetical protein
MPGDRENVVKLDADHSGVYKFGLSETDQDNLKLVRGNIKDLVRNALKTGKLLALPSVVDEVGVVSKELSGERSAAP